MVEFSCFSSIVMCVLLPKIFTRFCDKFCECGEHDVSCSGINLTYIPKIPKGIESFTMTRTSLKLIKENGFDNFSKPFVMKDMTFNYNRLEKIHPTAFSRFKLTTLSISNEPNLNISYIKHMLDNLRKEEIFDIYFTHNKWNELPTDLFRSFINNTMMQYLYLKGNTFTSIDSSTFSTLTNLESLDLSFNKISRVVLKGMPRTLQFILLDSNRVPTIPIWCKDSNRKISHLPNIISIFLNDNLIENLGSDAFLCLPNLSFLTLRTNNVKIIRNNTFSSMPALTELDISEMRYLNTIEPYAFNSTSLQSLTMNSNGFHFNYAEPAGYDPDHIFAHCGNLVRLSLADNDFSNINNRIERMFLPLTQLKSLDLSRTKIDEIPIFKNLSHLEELILAHNSIGDWTEKQMHFIHLKSLKLLDLSDNHITTITNTSFPNGLIYSLTDIKLSGNPFTCTCELFWFTEWIKTTKTKLIGYPNEYKCSQPPLLANTLLINYVNAEKTCPPWNPLYTLAIVLSASSLIFVVFIITLAKCHINIRNFIYLVRVRHKGYLPLLSSEDFEYDAFVVYCNEDGEWVRKIFIDKIECKGFTLCIHERDFDVGESIADNVEKYLEKSRKVIVVMSNEFTKNEWCQWEVDVVLKKLRHYGPDIFLLIILKSIDSKHMTSKLRSMIKCAPCLSYKCGVGEDLFWKAVIAAISKPIGHPPTALL